MLKKFLLFPLVAMTAFGFAAVGALADDDKKKKKNNPVITEVFVDFDDPSDGDTLKIIGRHLEGKPGKHVTVVMLGEQGPLDVLYSSDTEIIARCYVDNTPEPNFECDDGDYKLKVTIVKVKKFGKKDDDDEYDDDKKRKSRYASYDLTIGAVGPVGPIGPTGDTGLQGIQGPTGDTGPHGIQGQTGTTGAQGPQGSSGARGPIGPTGDPGPPGEQGPPSTSSLSPTNCTAVAGEDKDSTIPCGVFTFCAITLVAFGDNDHDTFLGFTANPTSRRCGVEPDDIAAPPPRLWSLTAQGAVCRAVCF